MAIRIIDAEIVGSREYSFTGNDGREVNMVQVFVHYNDNRVSGVACASVNIPFKAYMDNGLCIGESMKMMYAEKRWQYVAC